MIIKLKDVKEKEIIEAIKEGKLIIYPTDTIYGIGCDATNANSVRKIREIKKRYDKPFSVIAPSKQWIYKNFEVTNDSYIKKLPGPFTFILKMKTRVVADNVVDSDTLGVRIPDHSFTKVIQKTNIPVVTTSVNETGNEAATEIKKIPKKILKKVDFVINAGILGNEPSTILDLTTEFPRLIKR